MPARPRIWPSIRRRRLRQVVFISVRMAAVYPYRVFDATVGGLILYPSGVYQDRDDLPLPAEAKGKPWVNRRRGNRMLRRRPAWQKIPSVAWLSIRRRQSTVP